MNDYAKIFTNNLISEKRKLNYSTSYLDEVFKNNRPKNFNEALSYCCEQITSLNIEFKEAILSNNEVLEIRELLKIGNREHIINYLVSFDITPYDATSRAVIEWPQI